VVDAFTGGGLRSSGFNSGGWHRWHVAVKDGRFCARGTIGSGPCRRWIGLGFSWYRLKFAGAVAITPCGRSAGSELLSTT
jgi:hypothetical protein